MTTQDVVIDDTLNLAVRREVAVSAHGTKAFRELAAALPSLVRRRQGMTTDRIKIDPSVVRGLEYYTGPVYEVELTFPIEGRGRPAGALRLGRRRRALRWSGRALPRRAGAGDRLLHRRVAPAGGARSISARSTPSPSPGRWSSPCSGRADRRLPAHGGALRGAEYAPGKDPRRALSRHPASSARR